MTTVLTPDSPSGAYRVRVRTRAAEPTRRRVDHVDLLRGLVMVIMVLDHVRAYFSGAHFDPTDLTRTTPALFATRWITHYCAPVFVFLAGASVWIAGTRRTRGELARFLLSRGIWLVFLELTVISFAWYLSTAWTLGAFAQVIWAIGWSMVVLAGLIYLPRGAVAAIALAMVLGHNMLDGVTPERFGALAPLWRVLHVSGPLGIAPILGLYPLVPWIGVMALGFLAGPVVFSSSPKDARRLLWAGAVLVAGFVVLRWVNVYGDPHPRVLHGETDLVVMSFLNLTKYPPSLLYLLMTLGPALLALAWLRRARGSVAEVLVTFGRVPFLFYVAHLFLVHALAVGAGVLQGFPASAMRTVFKQLPADYGFGLPVVYLVWLGVVAVLYPVCRRYAALKARSRAWWLSYL
ncbi:MAG TPA: heparan-alpha-glucosaminide N-acetyltransferase domain-containing protein [Gemmatimonadales bacterium]|nr:heparan-alpha-glucosaminide N-acetyltransferase domain-containing protein [Gemmatimonadales bacterium]